MNQYDLEHWWVERWRNQGSRYAERLRKSGRISSDPHMRDTINRAAIRLFKRASNEMLIKRSGNYSAASVYIMKLIESIDGLALSHLIITSALNHLLGKNAVETSLAAIGGSIVKAVETELRIRFIEQVYPEILKKVNRGTFRHRNKAIMTLAGRASRAGLPRFFANRETKIELGMALVEMLLLASDIFEPYVSKQGKKRIWSIRVRGSIIDFFNRALSFDDLCGMAPNLGIYIEPPSADNREGLMVKRRKLVSHNWLSGQGGVTHVPLLINNIIQKLNNVGYVVNTQMLEWIRENTDLLVSYGMVPNMTFKLRESDDKRLVYNKWFDDEPKRTKFIRTMDLAERLSGTTFYHDWYIDFRGRMYTSSSMLSVQGNALNKSLVDFADKVTITEWIGPEFDEFSLYGARLLYGKADVSNFSVRNAQPIIERAIDGGLRVSEVSDEKDYLPFIRWCMDAKRLLEEGHVQTGIILRRDATANSIQHMATMAQDTSLMALVNLQDGKPPLPTDAPRDLYTELNVGMKRQALKSFIMTYCYNSTAYGRALERLRRGEGESFSEFIKEDARVQVALSEPLANVAKLRDAIAQIGIESHWQFTSPSGIKWDGVRYEWPTRRIWVRYNDARMQVRLKTTKNQPDENLRKTQSAFVANVIHSLDASTLHLGHETWPHNVAFIHDCVCGRPGELEKVCEATRIAFFNMHKKLSQENLSYRLDIRNPINYDDFIKNSTLMFV